MSTILDMPAEIIEKIVNQLSNKDYLSTQLSSSLFNVVSREKIFRRKYTKYPVSKIISDGDADGIVFSSRKLNRSSEFVTCLDEFFSHRIDVTNSKFIDLAKKLCNTRIIYTLLTIGIDLDGTLKNSGKKRMPYIYKIIAISDDIESAILLLEKEHDALTKYKNIMMAFAIYYGSVRVFNLCYKHRCKITNQTITEYLNYPDTLTITDSNYPIFMQMLADNYYCKLEGFWSNLTINIFDDDAQIIFLQKILEKISDKNIFKHFVKIGNIEMIDKFVEKYGLPLTDKIIEHHIKKSDTISLKYIYDTYVSDMHLINLGLASSAANNNIIMLKYFLNRGANPHFNNSDSIYHAIENGRDDVIRMLLDYGMLVTYDIVAHVVKYSKYDIFCMLVDNYTIKDYDILYMLLNYHKSCVNSSYDKYIIYVMKKLTA